METFKITLFGLKRAPKVLSQTGSEGNIIYFLNTLYLEKARLQTSLPKLFWCFAQRNTFDTMPQKNIVSILHHKLYGYENVAIIWNTATQTSTLPTVKGKNQNLVLTVHNLWQYNTRYLLIPFFSGSCMLHPKSVMGCLRRRSHEGASHGYAHRCVPWKRKGFQKEGPPRLLNETYQGNYFACLSTDFLLCMLMCTYN